ncbi:KpsF/GutQ family sugar-phosphate isomerase [Aestuariicoccus sp. MJ-SS9]|uniref:KpsF/GutQ family sugar-phosphate isomerase n=1 Tax=Aestuariicoccus sp. MJ-SS9 TaxID=3079855 RepID=UPI002912CD70|nr:KpsF/GutQ family sugar-phosphate isomerase [Aestuariicoccus sp. MJ-SS9]MDU8912140.1 KpsF/GutQ family sugar-phosphate isomerase [Aestuariicoccus sp. MJ-SS9]
MPDTAPLPSSHQTAARDVLTLEAQALTALADRLPPDFAASVDLILSCRGRVIVSGIGKSGHVARKVSATLASTGTPSYFVHAAEASHGDLGMIAEGDVVLLLSNSGETPELADEIAYCTRFGIPMIGMSSRPDSTLMRAVQQRLTLPAMPEACPNGMAPTTSTTMMLALGDALAVALMKARGFDANHFRDFHPGGKLGAQMTHVAELMHGPPALPLVDPESPMSDTLLVMSSKGFGIAAVVAEDGALLGIVTDGDLRRNMDDLMRRSAGQIATRHPVTVTPDTLAARALALMNDRKISVLLVIDDAGRPVGVLHIHDCLRAGVA